MNNKNIPLTIQNIEYCVAENARRQQALKNRFSADEAWVASKANNCIYAPGTQPASIHRKWDDVMAAAYARCLAYSDRHGDDALAVIDNEIVPTELKLAMLNKDSFCVGKSGALQFKSNGTSKPKSFYSGIGAHYEIKNNVESKRRHTIYTLADSVSCELIDMFAMDADTAYHCVTVYKDGSARPETEHKQKRCISLKTFIERGTLYRPNDVEVLGLETWEAQVVEQCTANNEDNKPVFVDGSRFANRKLAVWFLRISNLSHMIPEIRPA